MGRKEKRKASDYDWNRIEDMQKGRESGKGSDAIGGSFRVSKRGYDEGFDKIKSPCSKCGAERGFGCDCEQCGGR